MKGSYVSFKEHGYLSSAKNIPPRKHFLLNASIGREQAISIRPRNSHSIETEAQPTVIPVLIVGAGPVGLTMAIELARFRVPVRIIDKGASRSDKSKALAVWSRTLELLDRSGGAEVFVAAGMKVHAANFISGANVLGHINLDNIDSAYRFALMLPQPETERLLEERLQSYGVRVERQAELTAITQSGDHVSSIVHRADGGDETIESDWLLGCDGAHSTVRHKLGIDFVGDTIPTDFILADVRVEGLAIRDGELAILSHEEGLLAFFPMPSKRFRVIADVGSSGATRRADPTFEEVQAIVDRRCSDRVKLSDPVWISVFTINERKVDDYRLGRVFLAGDAAHVHSPAGGQGMNTGMQDAFNLAWKLALLARGIGVPGPLLESYTPERGPIAAEVIADSGRLTRIVASKNHLAREVRDFVGRMVFGFSIVQHAMADRLSETAVAYSDSPLNGKSTKGVPGPKVGHRIISGAPFGAGDTPRFAVMAAQSDSARAFLKRHAPIVEDTVRPPISDKGIWLVRPDGYVALVASAGHWEDLDSYLQRLTAR